MTAPNLFLTDKRQEFLLFFSPTHEDLDMGGWSHVRQGGEYHLIKKDMSRFISINPPLIRIVYYVNLINNRRQAYSWHIIREFLNFSIIGLSNLSFIRVALLKLISTMFCLTCSLAPDTRLAMTIYVFELYKKIFFLFVFLMDSTICSTIFFLRAIKEELFLLLDNLLFSSILGLIIRSSTPISFFLCLR